eukprot:5652872-Amphidinium_carterae.2
MLKIPRKVPKNGKKHGKRPFLKKNPLVAVFFSSLAFSFAREVFLLSVLILGYKAGVLAGATIQALRDEAEKAQCIVGQIFNNSQKDSKPIKYLKEATPTDIGGVGTLPWSQTCKDEHKTPRANLYFVASFANRVADGASLTTAY